jgi:VWFA-related protein
MRPRITAAGLLTCLLAFLNMSGVPGDITGQVCFAQTATPVASPPASSPAQQPELVKIYTEEVLLPVIATDSNGHFDPSLQADDLLILEDGKPQTISSVRRIPASVLLLLDTGGLRNPAMKTNATRDLAVSLVSQLRSGDQVAALQFGGRVELIQSWTEDQEVAIHSLKSRLSSGRNGRLKDALAAASGQLKDAPPGNRHIILVTDGGEFPVDKADLAQAMRQLYATQATVHIVSYTLVGRKTINVQHPKIPVTPAATAPKGEMDTSVLPIFPNAPEKLAEDLKHKSLLRVLLTEPYPWAIDLDYAMWRHSRDQLKTLKQNEIWLAWLAEESGGSMLLPNSTEDFPKLAVELAREIDAQYLVTYRPKIGVALKSTEEVRNIEVVSRRVGLRVHSRRSYVVPAAQKP